MLIKKSLRVVIITAGVTTGQTHLYSQIHKLKILHIRNLLHAAQFTGSLAANSVKLQSSVVKNAQFCRIATIQEIQHIITNGVLPEEYRV